MLIPVREFTNVFCLEMVKPLPMDRAEFLKQLGVAAITLVLRGVVAITLAMNPRGLPIRAIRGVQESF
jgi:hypothetical protein